MKIKLMKELDHWLGLPLCSICGVWCKLTQFFKFKKKVSQKPKQILILKWFGIGSIVLFSPFLKRIKEHFPESKIIFLTFESRREILELLRICDEIRTISVKNIFRFIRDVFCQLIKFGVNGVDICIDLEFFSKFSTLMCFLSGAKMRIGFYLPFWWRNSIINFPVYFNPTKHITRSYKMICRVLGIDVKTTVLELEKIEFSSSERLKFMERLKEKGVEEKEIMVVVNPNAGELAGCRRWPKEYFIELIENLVKMEKIKVAFIGTKAESLYVEEIVKELSTKAKEKILVFAGQLNIRELILLISLSKLVITNDSGPFHLAYIQKIPSISIWGPGTPQLYGVKDPLHKIFYLDYDCSPCIYMYRTEPALFCRGKLPCLKNIKPKEVIDSAFRILMNEEKS